MQITAADLWEEQGMDNVVERDPNKPSANNSEEPSLKEDSTDAFSKPPASSSDKSNPENQMVF